MPEHFCLHFLPRSTSQTLVWHVDKQLSSSTKMLSSSCKISWFMPLKHSKHAPLHLRALPSWNDQLWTQNRSHCVAISPTALLNILRVRCVTSPSQTRAVKTFPPSVSALFVIQLHNQQLQFLRMSQRLKNAACGNQLTRGINQEVVKHKMSITEIVPNTRAL